MKYAALLRGIGPTNPNMKGERLRSVCEELGFTNVSSIISSGNLAFDSDESDIGKLETQLEAAWQGTLGFTSTTIVKTHKELSRLMEHDPFHGMTHGSTSYLLATFFKRPPKLSFELPYQPEGKPYQLIGFYDGVLFTVTDNTVLKTTDLMTWLEKEFGKDITSRTWNTVMRIHKKQVDS